MEQDSSAIYKEAMQRKWLPLLMLAAFEGVRGAIFYHISAAVQQEGGHQWCFKDYKTADSAVTAPEERAYCSYYSAAIKCNDSMNI